MFARSSLITTGLLLPLTVLAFDYSSSVPYKDVRSGMREAAAINMLTHENIVSGYSTGMFGVTRAINRAEFLKITLLSAGQAAQSGSDCFSDVHAVDWFSLYVCPAKDRSIVAGYSDGSFKPAQTVSYGEALKMLTQIYQYTVTAGSAATHWAEPYYAAAKAKNVDLPMTIRLDSPLTRGQAARLVAAFLAASQGKLDELRLAESGTLPTSTRSAGAKSSVSSSASHSSSEISTSSSSVSSSVSSSSHFTIPVTGHLLVAGRPSDAIADGSIVSAGETARIRYAQVKLYAEATAIDTIDLVADNGQLIMAMKRRTTADLTDYKLMYEGTLDPGQDFQIPADKPFHINIRATVRGVENNGVSNQLVQVRTVQIRTYGDTSGQTVDRALPGPFPMHQTSFGRITAVRNAGSPNGTLVAGSSKVVASFSIDGSAIAGSTLHVTQLLFTILQQNKVTATHWQLALRNGQVIDCYNGSDGISCPNIPASIGTLPAGTPLILDLKADLSVDTDPTGAVLQLGLDKPGSLGGSLGAVQWTDDSGYFTWVEGIAPLAEGTVWK